MEHLVLDGVRYVVSPEFAAAIQRDLGTLEFDTDDIEARRLGLLRLSNPHWKKWKLAPFSERDQKTLEALTHVRNVASAIGVVGDHHDPVKEWGLTWDAVHGNAHHQECGCVRHYVFDHHSATNHFGHNRLSHEEIEQPDGSLKVVQHYERMHHEIEPLRVCEKHRG